LLLISVTNAAAQTPLTLKLPGNAYEDGQIVEVKLQFFKEYGDNHQLFAMQPDFIRIENGQYKVEIPDRYHNKNYFLEIIFPNGYETPRIFLDPINDYLPNWTSILLGALFIGVFSRVRFNRWTDKNIGKYDYSPRNFTTWTRFIRSLSVYVILGELTYFSILISPGAFVFVTKYLGGSSMEYETLKEMGQYSVLWSILLITGVLPNFPFVNKLEQKIRETLHDYAFIPAEAKAVISQLDVNCTAFKPDKKIVERVLDDFGQTEFSEEDFMIIKNTIAHKWCKLSYLKNRLQDWITFPKINRFFGLSIETFEQFLTSYESLQADIVSYYEYHNIEKPDLDRKYKKYLAASKKYINCEIHALLKQAYSLISIGVLGTEKLPSGRKNAFEFFGLRPYLPDSIIIDWDTNLKSIVAVSIAAVFPTLFYYFSLSRVAQNGPGNIIPKSSSEALFWALAAILMHGLTIIGVVMFNLWKNVVLAGDYNRRIKVGFGKYNQFAGRILAGLIGYVVGLFVMIGMTLIQYHAAIESIAEMIVVQWQGYALWPIIPFVTGYFIQNYLDHSAQPKRSAWKQGFLQGGFSALVAGTIAVIRLDNKYLEYWYFVVFCFLISLCIGAGIGFVFPQGYRKRSKKAEAPAENRRTDERFEIAQPVMLMVDKSKFACNMLQVSLGGAKLDRKINYPLGSKAQIEIPKLGKLNAFIVRKAKKNTFINFPYLDGNTKENFASYLDDIDPAQQVAV